MLTKQLRIGYLFPCGVSDNCRWTNLNMAGVFTSKGSVTPLGLVGDNGMGCKLLRSIDIGVFIGLSTGR